MTNNWLITIFPPIIVAVAVRRIDWQFIGELRESQALSPETARTLDASSRLRRSRLRRLEKCGAIVPVPYGLYYLNEDALTQMRHKRRVRALVAVSIVVALGVVAYFLANGAGG